jgi:site-specific DNA recombinase
MKQTAALYARVSTQHQEEEATILSQVAAIEEYATSQGYALRKDLYFLDEAVSGAKLDRPRLDRLRDQESEGSYQAVICLSPDRLARVYTLQVLLLEEFRQAGIQMLFVNQPPVSDNPQNQLLIGIQGLFSEYERSAIAERMRRGRLHCARQGAIVNPQTPYGYNYVPPNGAKGGSWEISAAEASVVRKIYAGYTQSEPMTIQKITNDLNQGPILPRSGKQWHASLVGNILRQTQYTGLAHYNRTQKVYHEVGQLRRNGHGRRTGPVIVPRPTEEWISIPVPPILEKDIWLMAQERLKANQKFASRNNRRHFYLLRGLLVCAVCGHTLSGRAVDGYFYYGCYYGSNRQQEIIRLLIDHVVVGPDEIVIKHIVPTDDDCRLKPQRQDEQVQEQLPADQIGAFTPAIQVRAQHTIDRFGRAAGTHDPLQQGEQLFGQFLGGRVVHDPICQPLFSFH